MKKNENGKFVVDIYDVEYIIDNMEDAIIAQNLWRDIRKKYTESIVLYRETKSLEQQLQSILYKGKFDDRS
jgi:hypothetical protein